MQEARRKTITDMVNKNGKVSVSHLANIFDKSEMTIHRDLTFLEEKGLLRKKRGGAIANPQSEEVNYLSRVNSCHREKEEIADLVYKLVEDGDTIMIDGSTTAIEVAKRLRVGKRITIFTHSPLIIYELKEAADVVLYSIGSYFSKEMVHFVGTDVEETVKSLNFSKCILGVGAISNERKIADPYLQLAQIKSTIINSSGTSIIVADHTKFGKSAVKNIADIKDISCIVTDSDISEKTLNDFKGAKILHKQKNNI